MNKSERIEFEKICKQIDFYFSDFNLNTNRYLRVFLQKNNDSIPLEKLLEFNLMKCLNGYDQDHLIGFLSTYPFQNVEFLKNGISFRRSAFVFDKKYLQQFNKQIIHVSKLPEDIPVSKLLEQSSSYGRCNVSILKRNSNNPLFISSALIVFDQIDDAEKFYQFGKKSFETDSLRLLRFNDYCQHRKLSLRLKKKEKQKLKPEKSIQNSSQTTITNSSRKKLKGFARLVASRTICFHKFPFDSSSIDVINLKQKFLKEFGLIYIFLPEKSSDNTEGDDNLCYWLFKNRALLRQFNERLKNGDDLIFSQMKTINNNLIESIEHTILDSDQFGSIEMKQSNFNVFESRNFKRYVKVVQNFFEKKT
ncbi:HAD 2 domain containing protein [Sarcoptes scabiei]|nr:HAD 2 domain containing protein [Sarcoptes scabiei]